MTRKPTHTPHRSIRVGEELWSTAKAVAEAKGETMTDVVTEALRRYVRRNTK